MCSPKSRPFTNKKHLAHQTKTLVTKVQDCWAARILDQPRMEQHSSTKTPATGFFPSQTFLKMVNIVLFQLFFF